MNFTLYNKTSKPVYVDWNKSSFISKDYKIAYYDDAIYSSTIATSRGASASQVVDVLGVPTLISGNANNGMSNTTIVKQEKVTFIPPKSAVTKVFNRLVGRIYFKASESNYEEKEVKGVKLYEIIPTVDLIFRNFVTYSSSEQFKDEFYIDNGFIISKIYSMKKDDFEGTALDKKGNYEPSYPFYKPTRFYITDITKSEIFN